jgi:hypothetical protein
MFSSQIPTQGSFMLQNPTFKEGIWFKNNSPMISIWLNSIPFRTYYASKGGRFMLKVTMTRHDLCACLATVAPCELLGMTLLRQGSPRLFPADVPRDILREAVTEIVVYTERCAAATRRLADLSPIPLAQVVIPEFGL